MKKQYLGDSVYAVWDGWIITLTVECDDDCREQAIFIRPATVEALIEFYRRVVPEATAKKTP